jgi:YVTN family beta-propeller protein
MKKIVLLTVSWLVTLSVIWAQDIAIEATIKVGDNPQGIATSMDGSKCYVPDSVTGDIYVIDTFTDSVIKVINIGHDKSAYNPVLSPDDSTLFVPASPDIVGVINTATDELITTIQVPRSPANIVFSNDGGILILYILSSGTSNKLSLVDTSTYTIRKTIDIPTTTVLNGFVITPDNKYLLATCTWSSSVVVVNLETFTIATQITVGSFPLDMAIDATGTKAFVTNYGSMDISIIDLITFSVVTVIPLTGHPFRIRFPKDGKYAWVLADSDDEVYIIDPIHKYKVRTIRVPGIALGVNDIALRPDSKLAVVTAADAGTITLIDANDTNPTFGTIWETLDAGGYVTDLTFLPDGEYVYVVNRSGGYVLACPVSAGVDSVAEAAIIVIEHIDAMLACETLTAEQRESLQKARKKLKGIEDPPAKTKIIKKVGKNLKSAMKKVKRAVESLQTAVDLDTTSMQHTLVEGVMKDVERYIKDREAEVGTTTEIIAAWESYNQGVADFNAGDYLSALDNFKRAFDKASKA